MTLFACAAPSQTTLPKTAVTPDEADLPAKKSSGARSELESIGSTEDGVMAPGKYQGGAWTIKPSRVSAYVNQKEVVLRQGKLRFAIPVKSVTALLYGKAAFSRADEGTSNLAGGKSRTAGGQTDVGILWTAAAGKSAVLLTIDKSDFANFMNALESVTSLKATPAER